MGSSVSSVGRQEVESDIPMDESAVCGPCPAPDKENAAVPKGPLPARDELVDHHELAHSDYVSTGGGDGWQRSTSPSDNRPTFVDCMLDSAKSFLDSLKTDHMVENVKDGETARFAAGLSVSAELYGQARGETSVTREGEKYTIETSGQLYAGAHLEAGAHAGHLAEAGPEVFAALTAGGKVAFKFDSKEDAVRGGRIMDQLGDASAQFGNPAAGLFHKAQEPSKADLDFLAKHLTSVELDGGAFAKLEGGLHAGFHKAGMEAGIAGGLEGEGLAGVRLELEDGKPVGLEIQRRLKGTAEGMVGIELGGHGDKSELRLGPAGELETELEVSTHVPLPKGTTLADIERNPAKFIGQATSLDSNTEVEAKLVSSGTLLDSRKVESEISLRGKLGEIVQSKALPQLLRGDFGSISPDDVQKLGLKGHVDLVEIHGPSFKGMLSVAGGGLGGEFAATTESRKVVARFGEQEPKTATE